MLTVRDPIRRRQPIERPLDIIGLELLVTVSQALLAGILLSLAAQLGGDARAYGLPIPGLLAVLAIVVGVGWLRWLVGGSGWVMASVCLATAILTGALWLLSLQDASLPRVAWLVGLLAAACAIYGLVAGAFLDGPHRAHWKGGISQPHRGVPETRATPARFSAPVQKVVDERLTNVHLPQVSLPSAARLKAVSIPRPTRSTPEPPEATSDGLSAAAAVAPHPPTGAHLVPSTPEVIRPEVPPAGAAQAPVRSEVSPVVEPAAPPQVEPAPVVEPAPAQAPKPEPAAVVEPGPGPSDATEVAAVAADVATTAEPDQVVGTATS
ncbi:MAG: hypothetical protein ABWZ82_02075, partial [Candidatus Limnocylindrales bacterium]